MIPSYEAVAQAHRWLVARYGVRGTLHEPGVRNALALAHTLATTAAEEPAAVFYALVRFSKALTDASRRLPLLLAVTLTHTHGQLLEANEQDLAALLLPIRMQTMDWPAVREWFRARTHPATAG